MRHHNYYVYIVSNRDRTIYIGVTNNLRRRISEHIKGEVSGYSNRHGCSRLVYFQYFRDIKSAIAREKQLKGWRRQKKVELIELTNKDWKELEFD